MQSGKLYIYTIPKAGTYFLAKLASKMGWKDTGIHVAGDHVLDTHRVDLKTAAEYPTRTRAKQWLPVTLKSIKKGELCFGHISPIFFLPRFQAAFTILACKRRLKDALVAEFVDLRFRRKDAPDLSRVKFSDDRAAFVHYLETKAAGMRGIAGAFLAHVAVRQLDYFAGTRKLGDYLEISFEDLFGAAPLPTVRKIAEAFGLNWSDDKLLSIYTEACQEDNKTKSTAEELPLDREALWTPEAEELYRSMGFPRLEGLLGYAEESKPVVRDRT